MLFKKNKSDFPSDEIQNSFIKLCKSQKVLDKDRKWVHLDRLWYNPNSRKEYSQILKAYLLRSTNDLKSKNTILVIPDTISSAYGIIPVAFIVADQLNIEIAIWQEVGDYFRRKPLLIGPEISGIDCIVIQDVIRTGTTILKMIDLLSRRKWNIIKYCGLVLNCPDQSKIDATNKEFFEHTNRVLKIETLTTIEKLF